MNLFRITTISFSLMLLVACGGRDADPIASIQHGDSELTCEEIQDELVEIQEDIAVLTGEQADARQENVAWGVAGLFFFPLWFGLDLTETERVEMRAYEKRVRVLERIARKKKCDF